MRHATEAEVHRLKGDAERMEIAYVKRYHPSYAQQYIDQARQTLDSCLSKRRARSAPACGTWLCARSMRAIPRGARAYLEIAATARVVRPRVYLETGSPSIWRSSLRTATSTKAKFAAVKTHSYLRASADCVTAGAAAARGLCAVPDACLRCNDAPSVDDLALVREGARLFPPTSEVTFSRSVAPCRPRLPERSYCSGDAAVRPTLGMQHEKLNLSGCRCCLSRRVKEKPCKMCYFLSSQPRAATSLSPFFPFCFQMTTNKCTLPWLVCVFSACFSLVFAAPGARLRRHCPDSRAVSTTRR